jgi:hypothetical protein
VSFADCEDIPRSISSYSFPGGKLPRESYNLGDDAGSDDASRFFGLLSDGVSCISDRRSK